LEVAKFLPYPQAQIFLSFKQKKRSLIGSIVPPKNFIINVPCINQFERQYHRRFNNMVQLGMSQIKYEEMDSFVFRHNELYNNITHLYRYHHLDFDCDRNKPLELLSLVIGYEKWCFLPTPRLVLLDKDKRHCPKNIILQFDNKWRQELLVGFPVEGLESFKGCIYPDSLRIGTSQKLTKLRVLTIDATLNDPIQVSFGHMTSLEKLSINIPNTVEMAHALVLPFSLKELYITISPSSSDIPIALSDFNFINNSIHVLDIHLDDGVYLNNKSSKAIIWPSKLEYLTINCLKSFLMLANYPSKLRKLKVNPRPPHEFGEKKFTIPRPRRKGMFFADGCSYQILELTETNQIQALSKYLLPLSVQKLKIPFHPGPRIKIKKLPRTLIHINISVPCIIPKIDFKSLVLEEREGEEEEKVYHRKVTQTVCPPPTQRHIKNAN